MQNSSQNIKYYRLELPIKTAEGNSIIKEKLECFYYLFFY